MTDKPLRGDQKPVKADDLHPRIGSSLPDLGPSGRRQKVRLFAQGERGQFDAVIAQRRGVATLGGKRKLAQNLIAQGDLHRRPPTDSLPLNTAPGVLVNC